MFQNLSAVFRNLFRLLSRSQTISQAEEMVRTGSFYAWTAMAYKQILPFLPKGTIQHTTQLRWWMSSSLWCLKAVDCCLSCRSEATPVVTEAVACRSVLYSANLCCKCSVTATSASTSALCARPMLLSKELLTFQQLTMGLQWRRSNSGYSGTTLSASCCMQIFTRSNMLSRYDMACCLMDVDGGCGCRGV